MEYKLKKFDTERIDFIEALAKESELEGFRFVRRTLLEWNSGENNFSKKGESFYGVFYEDECIAIGGLNIDPYIDNPTLGRVRHVYVSKNHRRKGIATLLLNEIMESAKGNFKEIRLYTPSAAASQLYENFGFRKSVGEYQSHIIAVPQKEQPTLNRSILEHVVLLLNEQKYVGIKSNIKFSEHDSINFLRLHEEVINANIKHINREEHFLAVDTDFTSDSFSYIPMLPVNSFEGNDIFFQFTRKKGLYYSFNVKQSECNPEWFKRVFRYMKENNLIIENTGYDMEYYQRDYLRLLKNGNVNFKEITFNILFKSI